MPSPNPIANPFAMMLDPQAVLAQVMHSERLSRLQSRICRPLDKPLLGAADNDGDGGDGDAEREAEEADGASEAAGQSGEGGHGGTDAP